MVRRRPGALLPLELDILECGLAHGADAFHGFELAKSLQQAAGSRTLTAHGTLYKALARLEAAGLLTSRWEDPAPEGRPRRRLYSITAAGEHALAAGRRPAQVRQRKPGLAT
jgi:DNA-binding PadR family transcriptional regulator